MKILQKVRIPVLTYHSIDESGSVISTAPEIFREQMKFLSESNFNILTLGELVSVLRENKPLPAKTAVLTFDDGFQNFYTTAFPVLKEYGLKATVFLVTDFCGKLNEWPGNPPDFPPSKILSWEEIKELERFGIEFGNHTRTHPDLTKVSDAEVENQIVESKDLIEQTLGGEVTTFAYPFGKFNSSVKQIVEKTYRAACSTNLGKVQAGSDFFSLERVDAYYLSNPKIFSRLSTKVFDNYLLMRHALRVFKSAVLRH